uniref:Uncharacterized protein n=1 Tax=Magallana gigas TaxID=29159 RepID=K1Q383_MAGGI
MYVHTGETSTAKYFELFRDETSSGIEALTSGPHFKLAQNWSISQIFGVGINSDSPCAILWIEETCEVDVN